MLKKVIVFCMIVGIIVLSVLEFKHKSVPVKTNNPLFPIYTIGDKSYGIALENGKNVIKFGPMFLGIYTGGLAFPDVISAKNFLKKNNWNLSKWDIYLLSGDYKTDVKNGHITKSLIVLEKVVPK